jgi:hypothetical protein
VEEWREMRSRLGTSWADYSIQLAEVRYWSNPGIHSRRKYAYQTQMRFVSQTAPGIEHMSDDVTN